LFEQPGNVCACVGDECGILCVRKARIEVKQHPLRESCKATLTVRAHDGINARPKTPIGIVAARPRSRRSNRKPTAYLLNPLLYFTGF
jgi:hypothetical protein